MHAAPLELAPHRTAPSPVLPAPAGPPPAPPPALRVLLDSDGTVTRLLESWFAAAVDVETRSNVVVRLRDQPPELELEPHSPVLRRAVILSLAGSGRPLLRATASVALRRLDPESQRALLAGRQPIGRVLGAAGLETRRELLWQEAGRCRTLDAEQLEIDRATPVFERSYLIISGSRPLAQVTERIPATLFEEES